MTFYLNCLSMTRKMAWNNLTFILNFRPKKSSLVLTFEALFVMKGTFCQRGTKKAEV